MAKKTAKKTAAKPAAKAAPKAAPKAAKPAAAPKPAKISSAAKVRTKGDIYTTIADHTGITRKQAGQVFDVLGQLIAADLKKGAAGTFKIPGLAKVSVVRKPATKSREGRNPFTGETITIAAKPARNAVRIRPLKTLKDMVA